MSDTQYDAYAAKCARAAELASAILPLNKQVLFECLTAAGILAVTMLFDGSSDSGQFELPVCFDADNNEVAIPTTEIAAKTVDFETGTVSERTTTPHDLIEALACELLEQKHAGWEVGVGAHGEFRLSPGERTITLDCYERYIKYNHHEYEF